MTDNRQHAVVLFDAVCNFCDGSVNWIIRHDRRGYFRFAALQSDVGAELQQLYGLDPSMLDTLVLIEGGGVYTKSTAGLRIARRLRRPWLALNALIAVPLLLRDLAYDWFAGRRYRWCGKREECIVPSSDVRERFLGNYAGHKTTEAPRHED